MSESEADRRMTPEEIDASMDRTTAVVLYVLAGLVAVAWMAVMPRDAGFLTVVVWFGGFMLFYGKLVGAAADHWNPVGRLLRRLLGGGAA